MTGRKPSHYLKALDKATDEKSGRIGAAWVNRDGTISIKLDPFVTLNGGNDLVLTLFPNDDFAEPISE